MSEDVRSVLEQLVDDTRPVRTLNLAALSDLPRQEVVQFQQAWAAFGPARRLELMTTMVEQAEANIHLNFHTILRACLSDGDAQVRKLAVEGLWEDEKISLIAPLTALLAHDPEADVRAAAAISLGRFVLLAALGEIADEPAHQAEIALRAAWDRPGESSEVRRRALEALGSSETPRLADLIQMAYYDEDALMRQSAIFAMGRNGAARWGKFILAELSSQEPAMRYEAAVAAGEIPLKAALQPLIRRLDDPDRTVREAAAAALGKIGGPVAKRALEAARDGADEPLAQAADEALAELAFNSEQVEDLLLDFSDQATAARTRGAADDDDWDDEDSEDTLAEAEDDIFGDEDEVLADLYEDDILGDDDFAFGDEAEDLDWAEEAEDEDDDQDWR